MKKVLLIVFTFLLLSLSLPSLSYAQTDHVQCDACGFCEGNNQPSNWDSCTECLYFKGATNLDTRRVSGSNKLAPTTQPGRYYTQLGCLYTGVVTDPGKAFGDPAAVGAIVNQLLNRFIFPLVGVLVLLYLIYGAFLLMTSQDDPERKNQGKKTITGAIVGAIFTLLSVFIVTFIGGDVLKIPGFARGSRVQIAARGFCAPDNVEGMTIEQAVAAPCEYPEIAIHVNDKLVKKFLVEGDKSFTYIHSGAITNPTDVKIEYVHDAQWKDTEKNINLDRNVFIPELTIDGKKCSSYLYIRKYQQQVKDGSVPLRMYWSGSATCQAFQ